MKPLQNLHTHTNYCDGAETPEEIVVKALEMGFSSIGFPGHSYMHYAPEHSMSQEGTENFLVSYKRGYFWNDGQNGQKRRYDEFGFCSFGSIYLCRPSCVYYGV